MEAMGDRDGTDGGIRKAREAATALSAAAFTAGLYPAGHAVREETIGRLARRLAAFFEAHDVLRLDVAGGALRWGAAEVHGDDDSAGLPAILHRDGVRRLAFRRGVAEAELKGLADLLGRYRVLKPEHEGDIVTGLWEARYPNILYEAEDPMATAEPLDLSALNRGSAGGCWGHAVSDPDAPGLSPDDPVLLRLTPEELDRLSRLVSQEENWEGTEDVLDVLVVILEEQADPEDFETLLAFIAEEFQLVLEAGDFGLAVNLLRNLRRLREAFRNERAWAASLLDDAFRELSGARFLSIFAEVDLDLLGAAALDQVRRLLSLLPPEALGVLVPMLPAARSRHARTALMAAAVRLARKDARPLAPFLEGAPPEEMARYLVEIARHLNVGAAARLLFRLARHPEAAVRRHAVRALLAAGRSRPDLVRPLLDDPDAAVRGLIHEQLGRKRDPDAERLLLTWLAEGGGDIDERRVLAFRTLGRCGSDSSLPALKRGLTGRPLGLNPGRSRAREAAAQGLAELDTPAAESLLARAARSPFPAVRNAAWRALEDRS
ncbi:MAG: HEAT repeat domain-containing protein [Desulfococcaceae bacterium]